jgi:hypothetical protein
VLGLVDPEPDELVEEAGSLDEPDELSELPASPELEAPDELDDDELRLSFL